MVDRLRADPDVARRLSEAEQAVIADEVLPPVAARAILDA